MQYDSTWLEYHFSIKHHVLKVFLHMDVFPLREELRLKKKNLEFFAPAVITTGAGFTDRLGPSRLSGWRKSRSTLWPSPTAREPLALETLGFQGLLEDPPGGVWQLSLVMFNKV